MRHLLCKKVTNNVKDDEIRREFNNSHATFDNDFNVISQN